MSYTYIVVGKVHSLTLPKFEFGLRILFFGVGTFVPCVLLSLTSIKTIKTIKKAIEKSTKGINSHK